MKKLLLLVVVILLLSGCSKDKKPTEKTVDSATVPNMEQIQDPVPDTTAPDATETNVSNTEETTETMVVNGKTIVAEKWKAITTDRLSFRETPGTDGVRITVYYYGLSEKFGVDSASHSSFLQGTTLNVLGKDPEKTKVGDLENYWCYVSYNNGKEEQLGWVFGAYLALFDEKKVDEYAKTLNSELEWLLKQ